MNFGKMLKRSSLLNERAKKDLLEWPLVATLVCKLTGT